MVVCICHRISDRDIARLMAAGCTDLRSLQLALGLGSCCGTCLDYVQEMLDAQPQRVCKVSAAVALGT